MAKPKIGLVVGSARRESINRKLAKAIEKLGAAQFDCVWITLDEMPIYNGDMEGQRPDSVNRFTAEVAKLDGVFFVTPEYNRSIPALLKNALDWGSKPADKNVWRDKPAAITGTSPGAIGTAVAQQHLRQILGILGMTVMGGEAYISFKPDLIDNDGNVADEGTKAFLQKYVDSFGKLMARFAK